MLDMRSAARAVADDQDDGGLSEFVVYDDVDAAGIPTPVGDEAWRDDPEIDPAKLAVSRNVLYGQGILLVVVAGLALLVGYVLGAAVGGAPVGAPVGATAVGDSVGASVGGGDGTVTPSSSPAQLTTSAAPTMPINP